jgi:hypothetical protein
LDSFADKFCSPCVEPAMVCLVFFGCYDVRMAKDISRAENEIVSEKALEALFATGLDLARRKSLARQWRDMLLESQELIPGTASTGEEFMAEVEAKRDGLVSSVSDAMSGKESKAFLRSAFGAPCSVDADVGRCDFWSFEVEGSSFIALWRSGRGMTWHGILREDLPPVPESSTRRSYGKLVLLSHDEGAPPAWISFCGLMGSASSLGPERAASLSEAFVLEASTPRAARQSKPLRC